MRWVLTVLLVATAYFAAARLGQRLALMKGVTPLWPTHRHRPCRVPRIRSPRLARGPVHIADAWITLMRRLGYSRFVAQGGDRGAPITDVMGAKAPPELLDIHSNMPGTVPPDVSRVLARSVLGTVPAAISVFPRELYQAPRSWAEQAYPNLIYFNDVDSAKHFAALGEPELFTQEMRAALTSLR